MQRCAISDLPSSASRAVPTCRKHPADGYAVPGRANHFGAVALIEILDHRLWARFDIQSPTGLELTRIKEPEEVLGAIARRFEIGKTVKSCQLTRQPMITAERLTIPVEKIPVQRCERAGIWASSPLRAIPT
jgi:hypothetical protein